MAVAGTFTQEQTERYQAALRQADPHAFAVEEFRCRLEQGYRAEDFAQRPYTSAGGGQRNGFTYEVTGGAFTMSQWHGRQLAVPWQGNASDLISEAERQLSDTQLQDHEQDPEQAQPSPRRSKRPNVNALMRAWCEAAEDWRRLRSDAAEARCRAARQDYYLAAKGHVPPLRTAEPASTWQPAPIAEGDRVRIVEHARAAYPEPDRTLAGVAVSVPHNRSTKTRRWLVDYVEHHYGRNFVREEHLEHALLRELSSA